MIALFDGGGTRRLTRAWLRHQLEAATNDRDRLKAQLDRALARAEEAEQRALTAESEYARVAGRPTGPDAETTVTLRVPALRDVHAAMGDGDYLNDTDEAWRARHATASETTQAIPADAVTAARAAAALGQPTAGPVIRVTAVTHHDMAAPSDTAA